MWTTQNALFGRDKTSLYTNLDFTALCVLCIVDVVAGKTFLIFLSHVGPTNNIKINQVIQIGRICNDGHIIMINCEG